MFIKSSVTKNNETINTDMLNYFKRVKYQDSFCLLFNFNSCEIIWKFDSHEQMEKEAQEIQIILSPRQL